MILANVNIGTGPSSGDGDPLRTAFTVINQNFTQLQTNVNALTNSVTTVAGRTGNVLLTTQDIIGINNYATITYVTSQLANAGAANITALQSNVASLQADVNTLYGNAGIQSSTLATLTSNAATQAGSLTTLTANAAAQAGELSTLLANAITQTGEIVSLLANAGSQHESISILQSNVSTLFANAGAQAGSIADLTSNAAVQAGLIAGLSSNAAVQAGLISSLEANITVAYSNSNVAAYLPTYSGNVKVNTVIFDDLSEQHTAYTGTQWRSNLTSNVTVKPSWMSYSPGLKNQLGTQYGFDAGGMFFSGNADNDIAYPIRTNLHIHETDVTEVIFTINFAQSSDDHGIAIFNAGAVPIWRYSTDLTRIAFQFSTGTPRLYGQTTQDIGGTPVVTAGNFYTIKFTYDPTNTVTVQTFSGNTATGTAVDTRTVSEILPPGDYIIGFDADQDVIGNKSYFTNIIVRTLTNSIVNDLEIQGQLTGNIIPSANVTYSLGNVTHQWKDLYVSSNTIYVGGTALTITNGNLTVGGNVVGATSSSIVTGNSNVAIQPNGTITIGANNNVWSFGSIQADALSWPDGSWQSSAFQGFAQNLTNNGDAIITADASGANTQVWTFSNIGRLILPNGGVITNDSDNIELQSTNNVNVEAIGAFNLYTDTAGNTYQWQFGNDGTTTFPDSTVQTTAWTGTVNYANVANTPASYGNTEVATYLSNYNGSIEFTASPAIISGVGTISTLNANVSGNLTFGDTTTQTTAYVNVPVTNRYYVDATRTDTYVQNGSQDRPYKTVANAQAAITSSGTDPNVTPIYILLLSNITENITLDTGHVYLVGQNGGVHQPVIVTGNITVLATSGTLNTNHFSLQGLEIVGGTNGKAIYVTGTYPTRLSLQDVWITANGNSGAGLYQDNSGTGTYTHGGPVKVSHNGSGDVYCFNILAGTASFDGVETSGATQVGAAQSGAALTFNNSQLEANGDVVVETYGAGILVVTNSLIKNSQANSYGIKLNSVANVGGIVSVGQTAFNVPNGTGSAVWLDANAIPTLSTSVFSWAGVSFYPSTNTTISPTLTPGPLATLVGTQVNPIFYGDITSYAIAQDWDLVDNNASALSFDTTGKAGILELVTTNSAEGVKMSGYANITGNVSAGNITVPGTSGKIGYSSGNFAQQTTSNSTQVTSHFTSGNIQLMSIDLAAHDVHTVAFACNKLTTNDMLIVKHIAGGLTSVYVDAYVASDGLAVIWMRDITGVGTGSFSPMLKYAIIRAPSA